ncbi:unnamed protein product [Amoebophrya sp. A25]|nr:unnamed protein product [Amoebophrya sp. A25]|eukprot:GSA25T00024200001.1
MTSVNQVLALLVLDSDHHRLAVKYCAPGQKLFPTVEEQRSFEKKVIKKLPKPTGRPSEGDVAIVGDNQLVLYKIINDVYICVLCSTAENEVILAQVLEGLCQALQSATQMMAFVGNGITKQSVLECLDQVLLVLDEVTDDLGIIMEVEEEKILNRIRMQDEIQDVGEPEPAEKMFQQATQAAKKRLIESLLGGGRG